MAAAVALASLAVGVYAQQLVAGGDRMERPLANGSSIDVYYECAGTINETAKHVVWMLNGGPGGTGLYDVIYQLATIDPDGVYCTTDYRGVGESTELRCSEAAQQGCQINRVLCASEIREAVHFADYYTSAAANDVIALVELGKSTLPNATHALYGLSYGTFWLSRIMQLSNDLVQHWIFDGVVLPPWLPQGGWQHGPLQVNRRLLAYLKECTKDPTCGRYYDAHTHATFLETMSRLRLEERGKISSEIMSRFIQPDLYANHFVDVVDFVNRFVRRPSTELRTRAEPCSFSDIVHFLVKANELYSYDRSNLEFLELYSRLTIDSGSSDIFSTMHWIQDVVRDERPMYTNGKVLILAGERDVQTDMDNSDVLHMYFMSLDVISSSLVARNTGHGALMHEAPGDPRCGYRLLIDFVQDRPLQTDCLAVSSFKNFSTATYPTFPPLNPSPTATSLPEPLPASDVSSNTGIAVALAVFVVLLVVTLALLVAERRRLPRLPPHTRMVEPVTQETEVELASGTK